VARSDALSAVALVDGEHYPPVVAAAIAAAAPRLDVRAALLLGGAEKLRDEPTGADFGVPRLVHPDGDVGAALHALVRDLRAAVVLDLSDEPVVSQRSRLRLAGHALAAGAAYEGAGFRLDAPRRVPYPHPAVAVVGTGKRVGKTAVSGSLARAARSRLGDVVVVAMGRGGPSEPELVDPALSPLDAAALLARSRAGSHAASDFLEDALLAGVVAVGCRRCGGGLHGEIATGNVEAGAALAAARAPALTIFEGSGAAFPPIACDRTLLVTSARTPDEEVEGYLGPFRVLVSDCAIVIGDEPAPRRMAALRAVKPELRVVGARLVPAPDRPLDGRRVAVFTTAPESAHAGLARALAGEHGLDVVLVSGALADRRALRAALADAHERRADAYLTELKAAAVDVVAETAGERGAELAFLANEPRALDGSDAVERLFADLIAGSTA
jgi:cyclic 2,3-diphosphoglycerate synthetase